MNNIRLAITLLNNLRPVGPVSERDHALLTDRLVSELGNDYANFLAEPIPSGNGAQVDWYVNANSRPQPMEELDPQSKSALLSAAESRKMSVITLANRLEQGSRGDKEIAKALRNAMITPDSGWLYDVDGKPVLVGWGYVSAQNEQRSLGLTAVGTAGTAAQVRSSQAVEQPSPAQANAEQPTAGQPTVAQSTPTNAPQTNQSQQTHNVEHVVHTTTYHHNSVVAKRPFNWLALIFWLLCALLALIFIWLLLSSSALNRWSTVVNGPKVEIGSDNDPSLQKIADLNKEITNLEDEARKRQQECIEQQAANEPPANNRRNGNPRSDDGRNPFDNGQPEQRADRGNDGGNNGSGPNNGQPNITIIMPQNGGNAPEQRVEIVPVPVPETPQQPTPPQPTPPEQPADLEQPAEPEQTPEQPQQTERQRELDDVINRSGVRTGALQITLIWKGKSDLDLSIRCPNGTRVYFKRRSSCGATLDRDANQRPDMLSREPVENIYWSDPSKIPPKIPVYVDYYDNHGDPRPNTPFRLRIRKTIVDPQTGESKVEDKIIDGVANGARRRSPRQIYVITNP
ncbi:hypothetical protein [Bartonella sp. HY406]|uniref:hypothetical protein n=1 Tax=Bartonella sp. HY406 TaxID=2979331 RepID=UPI0021C61FC6|nr:hypothetical protein [Bartonella sp. HY406]UXN02908.1 hypothetical protein N6B01_10590 [Bartonella sp. HY406]